MKTKTCRAVCITGVVVLLALASGQSAPASREAPRTGVIIPIEGEINDITRDSLRRRMDEALAGGARVLIFEMNTPGGLVTSARDICLLIKEAPPNMHTVAWVNPDAISAGAMISVACREIVVAPKATLGDCAPIMIGAGEIGEVEREKIETIIRSEFTDSAQRNGHDVELLLAMVTKGREVWWLEHTVTRERRFASADLKTELLSESVDAPSPWRLVESYRDTLTDADVRVAQPIDSEAELLTLTQSQAVAYGLATRVIRDVGELQQHLSLSARPVVSAETGWEAFAAWLNSPVVRGALLTIFLLGAYMEFQNPGMLLPGGVALLALLAFLGAPYVAGLAEIWVIVALALGVLLLVVELFLFPGFIVPGILGVLLIAAALVFSFVPTEPGAPPFSLPQLPQTWAAIKLGVVTVMSSFAAAAVGLLFLIRFLPAVPVLKGAISDNPIASDMALRDDLSTRVNPGDLGVVTGDLRPAGQARFGGEIIEVASQGEYVPAGRRVQVIRKEGLNVFVRPLPNDA